MKSLIATITTTIALSAAFASTASAAYFNEAPEFKSGPSTLSRATVAAAALGAAAVSEATRIPVSKTSLTRDEVCKEAASVTATKFNELTASGLN
jgi:hypothetical protein